MASVCVFCGWVAGSATAFVTCYWPLIPQCSRPPPHAGTHRYTVKQFLAVLLLTLGAISATCAEAFLGDTASEAARRSLSAAAGMGGGGGAALGSPCVGCGSDGALLATLTPAPHGAGAGAAPTPGLFSAAAAAAAFAVGNGNGSARQLVEGLAHRAAGLVHASGGGPSSSGGAGAGVDEGRAYMLWWLVGVAILTAVLVLQTLLSNYQNWCSGAFGKAPQEGMFWAHALSLPAFLLTARDLSSHAVLWSASPATAVVLGERWATALTAPYSGFLLRAFLGALLPLIGGLPIMWTYLAANVVSQYLCISGVYRLTGWADPLTVNVALTVRKFASLMLSIWVFDNAFTGWHWAGAVLVFTGALLYGYWSGGAGGGSSKGANGKGEGESGGEGGGGGSTSIAMSGRGLHHRGGTGTAGSATVITMGGLLVPSPLASSGTAPPSERLLLPRLGGGQGQRARQL